MIVLDASAAVQACLATDGFDLFGHEHLIAPALFWSEVSSALHEMRWRKEIFAGLADIGFARVAQCRLFTVDARLRRGASHVVPIIGPGDLQSARRDRR